MKRVLLLVFSIVVAILIVADISLFVSGSLEAFPTAEQIEKGRIVYGLLLVPMIFIEEFLLTEFFKKK